MPEWGRAPDLVFLFLGAQLTRVYPNHKVWLGSLESTYYWKYSVLFRMQDMNSLGPYKLQLWPCI